MNDDDRELREGFTRLRAEEERGAPAFSALRGHAGHAAAPRRRLLAPLALAAAAVLAAAMLWRRESPPSPPVPPAAAPSAISLDQWRAPTDFLLQTPGRELLSTVPALGRGLPRAITSPMPERSTPS